MQLKFVLSKIRTLRVSGSLETEVDTVRYDSRTVRTGSVFVALTGEQADGHRFIPQALESGASAIVVAMGRVDMVPLDCAATVVEVEDTRIALAEISALVYENPTFRLKLAGITGTNGKTTTAWLIKHLCDTNDLRCGLVGTVRYDTGLRVVDAARTTPESCDLQELFVEMRLAHCRAAAVEVSSHAIAQDRIRGLEFDAAIFTNLTQDHLDFHGTMEAYFGAKARWFTDLLYLQHKKRNPVSIVNLDDRYGAQLAQRLERLGNPLVTYGQSARAHFRANDIKSEFSGTTYSLVNDGKSFLVRVPLIGTFNVYNSLAAVAAAVAMGVPIRHAVTALATAPAVPGRLQAVPARKHYQVFVDYAHSPDALTNVLRTLRDLRPARLITVFGCGGDRDRAKRPLMARAAEEYSDLCIATSDNPRNEDPLAILADVEAGFQEKPYEVIADRRQAIQRAVALAAPRDIVLIAGKGHEAYQEVKGERFPFDDVQVATSAIADRMPPEE